MKKIVLFLLIIFSCFQGLHAQTIECLVLDEEMDFELSIKANNNYLNCFNIDAKYAGYELMFISESDDVEHDIKINSTNRVTHALDEGRIQIKEYIQPGTGSTFQVFPKDSKNDYRLRVMFVPLKGEAHVFLFLTEM